MKKLLLSTLAVLALGAAVQAASAASGAVIELHVVNCNSPTDFFTIINNKKFCFSRHSCDSNASACTCPTCEEG